MNLTDQKPQALRLLAGLENGEIGTADASVIAETLDPVLLYMIVRFLRETYPASDPAATAVLHRVVEFTSSGSAVVQKCKEGEEDSVSEWFEMEHAFGDFRGRGAELIELITDKLDS